MRHSDVSHSFQHSGVIPRVVDAFGFGSGYRTQHVVKFVVGIRLTTDIAVMCLVFFRFVAKEVRSLGHRHVAGQTASVANVEVARSVAFVRNCHGLQPASELFASE